MNMDAVLIVGAGILQIPMIRVAKNLGLYVICTDGNPHAPGFAVADDCFVVSTYDAEGHVQLIHRLRDAYPCHLQGVVTTGCDVAVTVAAAAAAAGVRGIPVAVAARTHDKAEVRKSLRDADLGIYQPAWLLIDEPGTAPRLSNGLKYPVVIKPLKQRASRGVTILSDGNYYEDAIEKAQQYGKRYLIEQCLTGTEHSIEGIFGDDGALVFFNIVDRFFDYSSGIPLELGHCNPTVLDEHTQQQMLCMFLSVARALGVTWGPIKIDCMLTADGPRVLEVTARLSGGFDSQGTCPLTGRDPMRVLLQVACGMPIEAQKTIAQAEGYAAAPTIWAPKRGMLKALPQWEYDEVIWNVKPGDMVCPPTHLAERCGFVLTHADTATDAWERGQAAAEVLAAAMEIDGGEACLQS